MYLNCISTKIKQDGEWICLFVEDVGFAYNVGLTIHKSRRAANDWYRNRKNKRARSVLTKQKPRSLAALRTALDILKIHVEVTTAKPLMIMPSTKRTAALAKYLKRLGFQEHQQGEQSLYLLITHQTPEE